MNKFKVNDRVRLNRLINTRFTQFDDVATIKKATTTGYAVLLNGVTYHNLQEHDLALVEAVEEKV